MFDLHGRAALITGGTAGIGLATARRFAAAGARVAILGRRDAEELAGTFGVTFLRCDVSDEAALRAAFDAAVQALGPLDVVVNNAGVGDIDASIEAASADDLRATLEVNLVAVYNGLRLAPARMNDGGSVVNIASVAAMIGVPGYARYGASKAAVVNLTRNAAVELAPRRIRVNAVCPGTIWSEMTPPDHPEVALIRRLAPLARVGEPEEVAGLIHFLASAEAGYITGQAICVDGGLSAGFAAHTIEALLA